MPLNLVQTLKRLRLHEGERLCVYDDATGQPIVAGTLVVGNPTIGVGRNLADPGLSALEQDLLLLNDVATRAHALKAALPWFADLDPVRSHVLLDMSFMGTAKLLKFVNMLGAMARGEWDRAARHLLNSKYARDVPTRARTLAQMLVSGQWPPT